MLTQLSEHAGCQKSYLSLCLKSKNHITLDHAIGMSEFLQFSDSEEEYFFLLIEKVKASTPKLHKKLDQRSKELAREAHRLKNQQQATAIVSQEKTDLTDYYDSWIPTALHTLTSVNEYQTSSQMTKRLGLSSDIVQKNISPQSLLKCLVVKTQKNILLFIVR